VADRIHNPEGEVRVAIVGKYTQLEDAYKSIAEALTHGGMANRVKVKAEWIDAEIFEREDPAPHLEKASTPSSCPAASASAAPRARSRPPNSRATQGALSRHLPRHADGGDRGGAEPRRLGDAGSEEFDHEAGKKRFTPVVYHLKEWVQGNTRSPARPTTTRAARCGWAPMTRCCRRLKVAEVYGTTAIDERHRHRYEVDIKYRDALEEKGLCFSGMSPDGRLPEIVEVKDHPWFIGVQFHPELKSKPFEPHPLFRDFIRAAKDNSRLV
jgi:CTP synthase